MVLTITTSQLAAVRQHGEQSYPHECCGVLLGEVRGAVRVVRAMIPCENARTDSPQNRYAIAPRELVRIQREARESRLEIVGFYHSHPDHPARWSEADLEEAHWLGCSYVITSVHQGQARDTNSFLLAGTGEDQKCFEDEAIRLLSDARG